MAVLLAGELRQHHAFNMTETRPLEDRKDRLP